MSFRQYIAKISKKDLENKILDIKSVLEKDLKKDIDDQMMTNDIAEFLGLETIYDCNGMNNTTMELQKNNSIDYFMFPANYINKYPQLSEDKYTFVYVSKEDILHIIKEYHRLSLIDLNDWIKESETNPEIAVQYLKNRARKWETGNDFLNPIKDKLHMPFIVNDSIEWEIYILTNLYNDTNWDEDVLIMYGW